MRCLPHLKFYKMVTTSLSTMVISLCSYLLKQARQIEGVFTLSLATLLLTSCTNVMEQLDTDIPVPSEQAAVPDMAEIGGGFAVDGASSLMGETITVSTKITEVLSPNLFTVYDIESIRGEEILAITNLFVPEPGANVEITGKIMELDQATIQDAYSMTLEPDVVEIYLGRPYIAVKAMELVD